MSRRVRVGGNFRFGSEWAKGSSSPGWVWVYEVQEMKHVVVDVA